MNFSNVGSNQNSTAVRQFEGAVVIAQPFRANVPLSNAAAARGKIVIVTRDPPEVPQGERCSFDEKAKQCLSAGAIGMLIANTSDALVDLTVSERLACGMITATYAAALKEGDYVIVDDRKIRAEEIDFQVISSQDAFKALSEPFRRRTQRLVTSLRVLKPDEFQVIIKVCAQCVCCVCLRDRRV